MVERKVDLVVAMVRGDRRTCCEEQHNLAAAQRICNVFGPLVAGTDAFVVPQVDSLTMHCREVRVGSRLIVMRITDEDVGCVAGVGGERLWRQVVHTSIVLADSSAGPLSDSTASAK